MKMNLLFQYKRPEYLKGHNAKEWHDWGTAYYRYKLYPEQRNILCRLGKRLKNRVEILYAAPAIENLEGLIRAHLNRCVFERTNFTKASKLGKHSVVTYMKAGRCSKAHSEPDMIENEDLRSLIFDDIQYDRNDVNGNIDCIQSFANDFMEALLENDETVDIVEKVDVKMGDMGNCPIASSLMRIFHYTNLLGMQWGISFYSDNKGAHDEYFCDDGY
jgi:hypothetical protein